jgi:hypothetical protein
VLQAMMYLGLVYDYSPLATILWISSPVICICPAASIRSFTAAKASYGAELLALRPIHNLED